MSFATGLIVGQLSVIIFLVVLIRFFLFAGSSSVKSISLSENRRVKVEPDTPPNLNTILERIYYNVDTHPSESMDWFTLLVALNLNALRQQALFNDHLLKMLNSLFSSDKKPDFIDTIKVTQLNLGKDYPLFNNCKVFRSASSEFSDGLEARFDIDFKDKITLGVETKVLLNYPRPMVAFLPVKASVSLVNFSGRASVSMTSSAKNPEESGNDTSNESEGIESPSFAITISFDPDFSMEFEVSSLVGGRSQLRDVPKIGQVIESAIRKQFSEKLSAPNFIKIPLPSIWKEENDAFARSLAQTGKTAVDSTGKIYTDPKTVLKSG